MPLTVVTWPLGYGGDDKLEKSPASKKFGGAEGDRTLDLRIANATLSQLSYRPTR